MPPYAAYALIFFFFSPLLSILRWRAATMIERYGDAYCRAMLAAYYAMPLLCRYAMLMLTRWSRHTLC